MEVALKGRHRFAEVARGRPSRPAPTKAAQCGSAPARCRSSRPAGPRTEAGTEGADGGGGPGLQAPHPRRPPGGRPALRGAPLQPFPRRGPGVSSGLTWSPENQGPG